MANLVETIASSEAIGAAVTAVAKAGGKAIEHVKQGDRATAALAGVQTGITAAVVGGGVALAGVAVGYVISEHRRRQRGN